MFQQSMNGLLDQLSIVLKEQQLWSENSPSAEALSSQAPFCCDTLSFAQWLQFVFEPKMRELCAMGEPCPPMSLSPMLEVAFGESQPELKRIIEKIDATSRNANV